MKTETTETTQETEVTTDETTETAETTQTTETTEQSTETTEQSTETAEVSPFYEALPEDWRAQVATAQGLEGDDLDKEVRRLERYTTFADYSKGAREAASKIREGQLSTGLPENPTDEQLKEYREANGIPHEADGYSLELGDGVVLSDSDQAIVDGMTEIAHGQNVSNATMSELGKAFFKQRAEQAEARTKQDGLDAQSATNLLRDQWGADYETNKNVFSSFIAQLPESVREEFSNARMSNGTGVMNSPEFINATVDLMRKANPMVAVVPSGDASAASVDEEIKQLEDRMGTDEWYKDDKAQARYRQLIDARDRMKAQAA